MRLLLLLVIAACGKSSSKTEEPAPAPTPTPVTAPAPVDAAPAGNVADHLAAGRKAETAKDWPTAVKELDAAIAIAPDDALVLSELTWASVFAKQGDHARDVGARAVQAAQKANKPKLLAMALNNLGLAEKDVDIHAARSLWKASLDLRPSPSVEKQLEDAGDANDATPAGDAMLAKLGVLPVEQNRKAHASKQDTKLLAALRDTGVPWDCGAGHCSLAIKDLACTDKGCDGGELHATGEQAKALMAALVASGAKAGPTGKASVECYDQDEGRPDGLMPADSCDVTPR